MEKKLIKFIQENKDLSLSLFGYDVNIDEETLRKMSNEKIQYFENVPPKILIDSIWFTEFQNYLLGFFNDKIIGLSEEGDFFPFCEKIELLPYEFIRREFSIAIEKKERYSYEDVIEVTDSIHYEGDFLKYFNIYHDYCTENNIIIDPDCLYLNKDRKTLLLLEKGYYEINRIFQDYGLHFQLERWLEIEKKTLLILPDKNSRIQYDKYKNK